MELPRLEPLWKKYRKKGLSIIAVQSNQEREHASKMIEEGGLTYHILQNEEANDVVNETFMVEGYPSTYLMDRKGRIMSYHIGFKEGDEAGLEKEIKDLLKR